MVFRKVQKSVTYYLNGLELHFVKIIERIHHLPFRTPLEVRLITFKFEHYLFSQAYYWKRKMKMEKIRIVYSRFTDLN